MSCFMVPYVYVGRAFQSIQWMSNYTRADVFNSVLSAYCAMSSGAYQFNEYIYNITLMVFTRQCVYQVKLAR